MGLSWKLRPSKRAEISPAEERASAISLAEWAQALSFNFQGTSYAVTGGSQEFAGTNFQGFASGAYKANGVVFACCAVRMAVFSDVRFQFRQIIDGRPGKLFGTQALQPLEEPWAGATSGDLLSTMIQHADLAGNWFGTNRFGGITTLRPDWTSFIFGSNKMDSLKWFDPEAVVVGYKYQPGGVASGLDPVFFLADEVAHFKPIPDPEAPFRGMSWLTPIIREVIADKAMTEHKISYLERGATPNLVVKFQIDDLERMKAHIESFKERHEGLAGAYRTMFMAAGMDATVVGSDLKQIDFKTVQGGGETRVAAAAGVPPSIVGLSEGLQGSSLNAGNYNAARRRFSDGTMRWLWRNACGSLQRIVQLPSKSELWYDERDCAFLREDGRDIAEIQAMEAQTMRTLVDGGFTPESVVAAVTAGDLNLLVHSGLLSVQLQEPGASPSDPAGNGKVPALN